MKRPSFSIRLSRWHEWLIYAATLTLTVTGLVWLLLDRFGQRQGDFGPEPNALLPWLLLAHGAAAYGFLIVAAMLVPVHMRLGWHSGRNLKSGAAMTSFGLFLALTGIALYYSTGEQLRFYASLAHWVVGLGLPLLLVVHVVRGKSTRPRRHTRR